MPNVSEQLKSSENLANVDAQANDEKKKESVSGDVASAVLIPYAVPFASNVMPKLESSERLADVEVTVVQEFVSRVLQGAELTEVLPLNQQTEPKGFELSELGKFVEFAKESGLKVVLKKPDLAEPTVSDGESVHDMEQLIHNVVDLSSGKAGLEPQDKGEENLAQDGSQASKTDAPKSDSTNPIGPEQVGFADAMEANPKPIEPKVITQQVIVEIENAVRNPVQTGPVKLEMSLEPKELGKLAIELSVENGKVTMLKIQAENNQTRMLLKGQIPALEQKFEGCVVKVENVSVSSFGSGHSEDATGSGQKQNRERLKDQQEEEQNKVLSGRRAVKFAVGS
jgi:flagellar hook-length control protein FliK